jgi:aspartyl-tRNA(Asn)/glutamyl-tRNA(Gln) amidotransferase subunit A
VTGEQALREAAACDERRAHGEESVLGGVPIALKDLFMTAGVRTTAASRMLENFIAPYDATVVGKLHAAGGISIGKLNMDEFAMGSSNENSAFGPATNPWDPKRTPGGSSGGSAAAVAAGDVFASLGTDTGGSVRTPASFCGVVGIKPTYGRVSRYGVIAFASSLDQVGPFARTVEDAALMLQTIAGHDARDSTSAQQAWPALVLEAGVRGMTFGVPKEYFTTGMQPEVEAAVRAAIAHYEKLGARIVEVSLPHTDYAIAAYYVIANAEASANLARYDGVRYGLSTGREGGLQQMYEQTRSQGFGAEAKRRIMLGTYVLSAGYYDAYYVKAQKVRTLLIRDFAAAFAQCDALLAPVAPFTAFKLGEKSDPMQMYLTDVFTVSANLAGLPALSLPCGFDAQGLPIGLQILGPAWSEATILRAARAYERETEWHERHP